MSTPADPRPVEDDSVRSSIGCSHCNGVRDPLCTCETDCGARRGEFYGATCPKSDEYADYLRRGLYSEEEIGRAVAKSKGERP